MPNTPDIDVSALAEALNEKLDRDGYNATNDIKEMMAAMGMPGYTSIDLTLPASDTRITIPAYGWLYLAKNASSSGQFVYLGGSGFASAEYSSSTNQLIRAFFPVRPNDSVQVTYTASGTLVSFKLIYCIGTQHLASN